MDPPLHAQEERGTGLSEDVTRSRAWNRVDRAEAACSGRSTHEGGHEQYVHFLFKASLMPSRFWRQNQLGSEQASTPIAEPTTRRFALCRRIRALKLSTVDDASLVGITEAQAAGETWRSIWPDQTAAPTPASRRVAETLRPGREIGSGQPSAGSAGSREPTTAPSG